MVYSPGFGRSFPKGIGEITDLKCPLDETPILSFSDSSQEVYVRFYRCLACKETYEYSSLIKNFSQEELNEMVRQRLLHLGIENQSLEEQIRHNEIILGLGRSKGLIK